MADVTKACVVCGAESHRDDWINVSGDHVDCDNHSKDEVNKAISAQLSESARQEQAMKDAAAKIDKQVAAQASSTVTVQPTAPAPTTLAPTQAKTAS
jgi:hypothetical protein